MKKNISAIVILLFLLQFSFGQRGDTISVYFLYGSKPDRHCKNIEQKYFGGFHGGHVSIGLDTTVIGFGPFHKFHIFSQKNNSTGKFFYESHSSFVQDTAGFKYTTFRIAMTDTQMHKLRSVIKEYVIFAPYDYAFLGMRCASATYDILSRAGVLKHKSRFRNTFSNFYPKLFRKKMFRYARKRNWQVTKQPGRNTRKWEKD